MGKIIIIVVGLLSISAFAGAGGGEPIVRNLGMGGNGKLGGSGNYLYGESNGGPDYSGQKSNVDGNAGNRQIEGVKDSRPMSFDDLSPEQKVALAGNWYPGGINSRELWAIGFTGNAGMLHYLTTCENKIAKTERFEAGSVKLNQSGIMQLTDWNDSITVNGQTLELLATTYSVHNQFLIGTFVYQNKDGSIDTGKINYIRVNDNELASFFSNACEM